MPTRPARPSSDPARPGRATPDSGKPPQVRAHRRRKAKAHAKAQALHQADIDQLQAMPVTHRHAAGIDIGQGTHWVCVGFTDDPQRDSHLVRPFPSHTQGLREIVAFLRQHQVTTVALEATGIYWIALFEMLQSAGLQPMVVDPCYTRQIKGRPKTDKRDAQWIYRLHAVGMLQGAFRPDEQTCVLRNYLRQRGTLVRDAARHTQRMQKALEQMNLKLTNVLSDITGATGQRIIQAILRGTRAPDKLAALRHQRCKASAAEIARALDGSYRDEHLLALRQAYRAWQFYHQQIDEMDAAIRQQLERMKSSRALPPLPRNSKAAQSRQGNAPRFDVREALYYVVGVDLTQIEGVSELTALTLIGEVGCDLSRFATVKKFCSWLALCPNWKQTGGKVKSSRTRPGSNRAGQALRVAASGLHHSKGALGGYLRRMKGRLGAGQAVTATAHKLARLVYYALTRGMEYVRQSQEAYAAEVKRRQIAHLKKKARQLGLEVREREQEEVEGASSPAGAEGR
jgi:transposase